MRGNQIIWRSIKQRACINIFYGTTSGTTNDLAIQMAELCEQQGFYVRIIHIEHFDPSMMKNCNVVIFFLSSYRNYGGPTDDAQQFYVWLNNFDNQGKPLVSLQYSIFGLYNSKVKRQTFVTAQNIETEVESTNNLDSQLFNQKNDNNDEMEAQINNSTRFQQAMSKKQIKIKSMGKRIDLLLNEVGAKKFYKLVQIDSSKEELLQETFKQYSIGIISQLKEKYEFQEKPEDQTYNQALLYNLNISICSSDKQPKGANNRKELEQMFNIKNAQNRGQYLLKDELYEYFTAADVPILKIQYLVCDGMKDTITIHSQSNQNSANVIAHASTQGMNLKLFTQQHQYLLIDLDVSRLPSPPGKPKFETGGLLQIYPQNDDDSVKKLCDFLGLNENAIISLSIKDQNQNPCNITVSDLKYPIPFPITIRQYLKEFLDIHGPLDRNQINELAKFSLEQVDKDSLINLCKFSERERFDKEIHKQEQHSLLSLLITHNIKVPFHILFGLGKLIKPRTFIISSSFLQNPNVIQLTVRIHIRNHQKIYDELTEQLQQHSSQKMQKLFEGIEDENSQNQNKPPNISVSKPSQILNIARESRSLGLISGYLLETFFEHQKKPHQIRVKSISNNFQLPLNDINIRVILICIDEGIALFRSYLQQIQQVNNIHNHEIYLYYGCRLLINNEYLYQNDLNEFEKKGIIKKLEVAITTSNNNGESSNINKTDKNILQANQNLNDVTTFSQLSAKNNSSSIQFLLENQIDYFSQLIEGIDDKDSNVRIYISGTQLMSQGILGAIAKSYMQIRKQSQIASFNTVLNFENEGKIVRIIWES